MAVLGLLIVLIVLVFFVVRSGAHKKEAGTEPAVIKKDEKRPERDFETLKAMIRDKKSTSKELADALDLIIRHHPHIHPKLGIRSHPQYDAYEELILLLCWHPNANSKMIVKFEKELSKINPAYKKNISDALTKGLNSRGV